MSADDDGDCTDHIWRLKGVGLMPGGAQTEYECERPGCAGVLLVGPDEPFPDSV